MPLPIIATIGTALAIGAASMLVFTPGLGDFVGQMFNRWFMTKVLSPVELTRLYRRGEISESDWLDEMSNNGFNEERSRKVFHLEFDTLTVPEILRIWYRHKDEPGNPFGITPDWINVAFRKAGVPEDLTRYVIEANRPFPNPDDIIRFGARDVFESEQVKLGKLDEGLYETEKDERTGQPILIPDPDNPGKRIPKQNPGRFLKEMAKQGFDEETAKFYWRAHWNIPSINQAFEMYQRLFDHPDASVRFADEEMDTFFRVADIANGYRERLKQIAYNPITRVDVRRFDLMGLYGKTEAERKAGLTRAYREVGYSPASAEKLAEFTIKYNDPEDKEFSREQVLKFYREGLFKDKARATAVEHLRKAGYTEAFANLMLDFEDMQIISADEQEQIEIIRAEYMRDGKPSENKYHTRLAAVNLTHSDIKKLLRKWEGEKVKDRKLLTKSDYDKLRRLEIIADKDYIIALSGLGYDKSDIDLLLQTFSSKAEADVNEPTGKDLVSWLAKGVINPDIYINKMEESGYALDDIYYYALAEGIDISSYLPAGVLTNAN